jgi:hypothetical protein
MKKIILAIAILMIQNIATQAQLTKVAVISVFGDKNLTDNPLETEMYKAILEDDSWDMQAMINEFDKLLLDEIVPLFPFPFMAKEEVVTAEGYKGLHEKTSYYSSNETGQKMISYNTVPAENYVAIAAFGLAMNDDEAILASFDLLPEDVDGVMIAYINFNIYTEAGALGITTEKIIANCNIKIFNREGSRIFKLKENERSNSGVTAVGGFVTDPDKIIPLIVEAKDNLFEALKKKLPKKLAKMAKKIDKSKGEKD